MGRYFTLTLRLWQFWALGAVVAGGITALAAT